jgi:hypothetical protein
MANNHSSRKFKGPSGWTVAGLEICASNKRVPIVVDDGTVACIINLLQSQETELLES